MYGAMHVSFIWVGLTTTEIVLASGSLFALLKDIAVLLWESYQRMDVWEKKSQDRVFLQSEKNADGLSIVL